MKSGFREFKASLTAQNFLSEKFLLTLVFLVGALQIASYYISGMLVSTDGSMPVPQPDTLLYCQAARRIAEGHPFSFSAGEMVSTGTTSVLYPFVLAIPYWAGAHGGSLITVGFWLNAVFYLIFLLCWALAFSRWTDNARIRLLASVILAIAMQPATCALAQSDTGLMMAVSAILAVGLAFDSPFVWGAALVLSPWVRPEGMMCVIGVGGALVIRRVFSSYQRAERPRECEWIAVILAGVSVCGVFALNVALTGEAQFSSVANKGYFTNLPFATAIMSTFSTGCSLLRIYFFGLGNDGFYDYLAVPLLGGVVFLLGMLKQRLHPNGDRWRMLAPLAIAAALSFASVAASGWQGSNFDRYLAWCQPVLYYFVAAGVVELGGMLGGASGWILAFLVLGYNCLAAVSAVCCFSGNSSRSDRLLRFARAVDAQIPKTASVGGPSCNMAYMLGDRKYMNFTGLYSPEFQCKRRNDAAAKIEILRCEKECRPDYLLLESPETFVGLSSEQMDLIGSQVLTGPMGLELRKADWSLFDNSLVEPAPPSGKRLVARVNVGYARDERRFELEFVDRWNRSQGDPFVKIGKMGGKDVIESGRVVVGKSVMHVRLEPRQDATIVVRATKKATAHLVAGLTKEKVEFRLADELAFDILVNGRRAAHQHVHLPVLSDEEFVEFKLDLEGDRIAQPDNVIEIAGDHNACEYRIYQ